MYFARANGQLCFRAPYDNLKFRSFWSVFGNPFSLNGG